MSTYHLHARLFEGSLAAPTQNELQSDETDDWDAALARAEEFAHRGFKVWIYDHGRPSPFSTACNERVVAEFAAGRGRMG